MTFAEPPPESPRPRRGRIRPRSGTGNRRSPLATTLLILGAVAVVITLFAQVWTEVLWYAQLGMTQVWTTRLLWQLILFIGAGAVMAGGLATSLWVAYRSRPLYPPGGPDGAVLERYRATLEPLRKLLAVGIPVGLGLFVGSAAATQWQSLLLMINGGRFGRQDPQFGIDIGFFVFDLPFLRFLVGFLLGVTIIALIGAAVTHYVYGGLRLGGQGERFTPAALRQLSILACIALLLQALSYWLERYGLLTERNDLMTGASYTGVHAELPARTILTMVAVIVALTMLSAMFTRNLRLPAFALVLMMVAAAAVGFAYPMLVQQFQVRPSQQTMELPYLKRNIEATREAYGLTGVKSSLYRPTTQPERGALAEDAQTTASIRLMDPAVISPAFVQLERNKQYYGFAQALDVDRYTLGENGQSRDTVIAVRELNLRGLSGQQRSWVNDHIVYTHGYGVVAAYGNQRNQDGEPKFFEAGIPSTGELGEYEQRIYFGENTTNFSIVGGETDRPRELDYPTDASEDETAGGSVAYTTFEGNGGPVVGNLLNKTLFAIKFRDQNILLSSDVKPGSQILYDRTPRERVQKVAPFLTMDGDPYPAVVDGRVVWIIDGYTTTNAYPYAERKPLGEATTDTLTQAGAIQAPQGDVNYIRNSVKATVDAYDGKVTLYTWDEQDPILKAWAKAFPGLIEPMSSIDSDLMSHLRYPEDLFKVQREVLGRYHVSDPGEFYSGQDAWENPPDPTVETGQGQSRPKQPPYYMTLKMPGQESPSFSLTSTYIPASSDENRSNLLTGFIAVDADAGRTAGKPAESYGTIRLLQIPRNPPVSGPGQVQNDFNSDTTIQQGLNVLRVGGSSEVRLGNLLTLPLGDGLLYVQPAYVQSKDSASSYPLLRKVLVSFGGRIGYADTLDEALNQVFQGESGAAAGDAGAPPAGEEGETPAAPQSAQEQLSTALAAANAALEEGQRALADGDFAAYGQAQEKLKNAIAAADQAQGQLNGGTPDTPATPDAPATEGATPADTPTQG